MEHGTSKGRWPMNWMIGEIGEMPAKQIQSTKYQRHQLLEELTSIGILLQH
jgi:hypothetical protein